MPFSDKLNSWKAVFDLAAERTRGLEMLPAEAPPTKDWQSRARHSSSTPQPSPER